jgi:hypothetical protein
VIVTVAPPLHVAAAEAVHEQEDPAAALLGRSERAPVAPQLHRDGQRIAARFEMVADDAVERRQHRLALERRRRLAARAGSSTGASRASPKSTPPPTHRVTRRTFR